MDVATTVSLMALAAFAMWFISTQMGGPLDTRQVGYKA